MGESKPGFQSKQGLCLSCCSVPKSNTLQPHGLQHARLSRLSGLSEVIIQSLLESMYSSIDQEDWMRLSVLLLSIKVSDSLQSLSAVTFFLQSFFIARLTSAFLRV